MTAGHPGKDPTTEHLSDHGLLTLIAGGDRAAFARLYDQYSEAAYSLAVRVVRDRELAADVVQEAFLAVWNQARTFDVRPGQPSTWILNVAPHKAVERVRREQRRRTEPIVEGHEGTDPGPPADERAWLG